MRTKTLLVAAALAAGVASSMAQSNVYSLNVVGYVNKTFVGPSLYTGVANPLNTTNNTLAGLFGTGGNGLPAGSQVLKWNTTLADYDTFTKTGFGGGWSPVAGATATLNPGEGALIRSSAAGAYTNTFVGEVLQGSLVTALTAGYNLVGNKVPDSGSVNALGLAYTNVPAGSQILKWNTTIQDFDTYNRTPFAPGYSPSVPNIDVADGFFINAGAAFSWTRNFTVQ